LNGRKLTYAIAFFLAILVIFSGVLYYYNGGKIAIPLQGPYISISSAALTGGGQQSIENFSAFIYLTTTNSSSNMNDVLLFSGSSAHGSLTGYLNRSFYSITGSWNSILQSSSDNISLSLYAFYDNVSGGKLHVYSFYNNLPYNPASKEPSSFSALAVFNLSMPELVISIPSNTVNNNFAEQIQFINSSTVQNAWVVLGSYMALPGILSSISLNFFPSNRSVENPLAITSFRGISYINGSRYAQESVNDSFSGGSFNMSGVKNGINTNSDVNLGPVELHVSNFQLYSGYIENNTFNELAMNYQTTLKVSMTNSTLQINETDIQDSSYIPYFDKFISKYTSNVTKIVGPPSPNGSTIVDRNWTSVNGELNLNISEFLNNSRNLTVLYTNLGLSLLNSDFSTSERNTNLSPESMLSEQVGKNLPYLVDFSGMTTMKTNGTYYMQNLVSNTGNSGFNASYFFTGMNISLTVSSKWYYGPLPVTAVLLS